MCSDTGLSVVMRGLEHPRIHDEAPQISIYVRIRADAFHHGLPVVSHGNDSAGDVDRPTWEFYMYTKAYLSLIAGACALVAVGRRQGVGNALARQYSMGYLQFNVMEHQQPHREACQGNGPSMT